MQSSPIVIKSAQGATTLEFIALERSEDEIVFRARLVDPISYKYSGEVRASTHLVPPLSQFFRQIAEQWKGWNGEIRWESIDGKDGLLNLVATSDALGHVFIAVEMRDFMNEFRLRGVIKLEAGQLDSVAQQVEKLFGDGIGP